MRDVRDRQFELVGDVDRLPGAAEGGIAAMLLRTIDGGSYPTAAATVYACYPVLSDAGDSEGDDPDLTEDSSAVIFAANVGSAVPDIGTDVIAHAVGGRWVFRYDG